VSRMYTIIVGCELIGARIAVELANLHQNVVVIERDQAKLEGLASGFNGMIVKGIEFDQDNLCQAGIERADVVLALTDDDNLNITVSLVAMRVFKVKRVIAQVIDPNRRYLYELLGIESFSPIKMGVNALLSKMDIAPVEQLVQVSSGIEITRIEVKRVLPIKVKQVYEKCDTIISVIVHNGVSSIANDDAMLEFGDLVVCSHHLRDRKQLLELLVQEG